MDCIRRKSGGGYAQVCLSSSSRQTRRGERNGRMGGGAARPWAPASWCMLMPREEGKMERRLRGSNSGPHLARRRSTEGCPRRWVVGSNGERRRQAAARGRGEVLGQRGRSKGRLEG
jgi:hypothetical protein